MAVFFSVVSKMVSNIDIFQGIVSKLVIPVSWQHYSGRMADPLQCGKFVFQMAKNYLKLPETLALNRVSEIHFMFLSRLQKTKGMHVKWI